MDACARASRLKPAAFHGIDDAHGLRCCADIVNAKDVCAAEHPLHETRDGARVAVGRICNAEDLADDGLARDGEQDRALESREPAEVATSGKVPGALAIPRGLVEFRADPASALHDAAFDRAKTVIAYCASGGRSALVGKTLKDMGYENVRNLGGFKGWLDAGGDVEKG